MSELCPFDDRRLPRELYVKLVVVHVTVIAGYAHLLHVRREKKSLFRYFFAVVCPLAAGFSLVAPVLVLAVQLFVYWRRPALFEESVAILLGERFDDEETSQSRSTVTWPPKLSAKLGRDILVQLLLMAQCLTTVYLFKRRQDHRCDALYDYRILHLATLGICVSIMAICQLISRPRFQRHPIVLPSPKTAWLEDFRYFITLTDSWSLGEIWAKTVGLQFLSIPQYVFNILSPPSYIFPRRWPSWPPFLDVMGTLCLSIVLSIGMVGPRRVIQGRITPPIQIAGRALAMFMIILGVYISLVAYSASAHQMLTLLTKPKMVEGHVSPSDWNHIWTFGHAPTTSPCPMAWKDPQADYLWWLA